MVLLEMDYFEDLAEVASALEGRSFSSECFSPIYYFLLDWALSRGMLDDALVKSEHFFNLYQSAKSADISINDFVCRALDGKIVDDFFKKDYQEFFKDYILSDALIDDLKIHFNNQPWFFPDDVSVSGSTYDVFDLSYKNYCINKFNFPNLTVFYDPDVLIRERALVGEAPQAK